MSEYKNKQLKQILEEAIREVFSGMTSEEIKTFFNGYKVSATPTDRKQG